MAVEATHQKFIWKLIDKILDKILPNAKNENTESTVSSSKGKAIIITIFSLIIIDYFLNISENIVIGNKIEKINQIENVLKSKTLDSITRNTLIYDQRIIAIRHSWQYHLDDLISLIQHTINSPMEINSIPKNSATIYRSNFWHILTSAWVFIVVAIISTFYLLFSKDIKLIDKMFIILILGLFFSFSILGISYLFAQIPLLIHPIINYIVNFLLNALIVFSLVKIGENAEQKGYLSNLNL